MKKLSALPIRTDHTDRECSEFLTGVVASLCALASPTDVRNAFRYWAGNESDHQWETIAKMLREPAARNGKKPRKKKPAGRPARR